MMLSIALIIVVQTLLSDKHAQALSIQNNNCLNAQGPKPNFTDTLNRRDALTYAAVFATAGVTVSFPDAAAAVEGEKESNSSLAKEYDYEHRDRNKNKDAIIRDDIWYFTGQNPPRTLNLSNLPPGPKYNAWGSCVTDASTGNSCTYVSLKQRIPAYSQYSFSISLGAKEFTALGKQLRKVQSQSRNDLTSITTNQQLISLLGYVEPGKEAKYLPPASDALLKMVLLATALLTSPNYTGPPFELLIARYYINEAAFSIKEITEALKSGDVERASAAWAYGADSWNSYFTIVNNAIVPKVGEKFEMIEQC